MPESKTQFLRYTRIEFTRFKAFEKFKIDLTHFNVLVGPNNAGKSTILSAFRILAVALRRANSRKAELVDGPGGPVRGHRVDLTSTSVAEENIFYNYNVENDAEVLFHLSDESRLRLYFTNDGGCLLLPEANGKDVLSPSKFRRHFRCPIGFVPILGPVEHNEPLYGQEAARQALHNYRAARNFRNIWYHFPDKFDSFRKAIQQTWPGMDIERPELDHTGEKPKLFMFCPEDRIPRELFWSGFGFQVWCQMLTHIIQSSESSIFLIDEPDIYLHSDLQRQLLGLLRDLGPDIVLATHSTEIITEAETDEIVLINKERKAAKRLKNPSDLGKVFEELGSNTNPILTQLAKTKKVVFVEGKDFQVLSKFARKLGRRLVADRKAFAVVPIDGFNPDRAKSLKMGMESTLGTKVRAAVILDRDYRCEEECKAVIDQCKRFCDLAVVHSRKEIENFLMAPEAIDRAARKRLTEREKRTGQALVYDSKIEEFLGCYCEDKKDYVMSQVLARSREFMKRQRTSIDEATDNVAILGKFNAHWATFEGRLKMIPGKDALSAVNGYLSEQYKISITETGIVDSMIKSQMPEEVVQLVESLNEFCKLSNPNSG